MTKNIFTVVSENRSHNSIVEELAEIAFGPGRFARTAFRLREGVDHEMDLSFVALNEDKIVGSVRLSKVYVGEHLGLLLGPLVVSPDYKNSGVGQALLLKSIEAAKVAGQPWIILVGDEPYYARVGFRRVKPGTIILPGPVDPARLLICELSETAGSAPTGKARAFRD